MYILCTKPPVCLLFRQRNSKHVNFKDLEAEVIPVFPIERSINIKAYSVRRKQVPTCPAFSLTDYKIQGSTLKTAILDLKANSSTGRSEHKNFCSLYVQLSRLQSFDGLYLLQAIEMKDLKFRPDKRLIDEMRRLQKLEDETLRTWMSS